MHDIIENCIKALQALLADSDGLDGITTKLHDAEAKLSAVEKTLADATAKLNDTQNLLTSEQKSITAQHDSAIFDKNQELKQLGILIETAKAELADNQAKVKIAKQQHEEIEASLLNLRKKFA
jgi:chromosome segregation ATPase